MLIPAALAATALVLAACSSSSDNSSSGSGKPSGTLVVFAATSLTDAFNKIGNQFEKAHPGLSVKFNYNGSSSLGLSEGSNVTAVIKASDVIVATSD